MAKIKMAGIEKPWTVSMKVVGGDDLNQTTRFTLRRKGKKMLVVHNRYLREPDFVAAQFVSYVKVFESAQISKLRTLDSMIKSN